jgi:hypothetical protein
MNTHTAAEQYLTKEQAIEAMKRGEKVTHRYFSRDEWVAMDKVGGAYLTEEGYRIGQAEFWEYRKGESWETGYSIWKPAASLSAPASQTEGDLKQRVIDVLEVRRKEFADTIGHSYSEKEVRAAIRIINEYMPPEYFDRLVAAPAPQTEGNLSAESFHLLSEFREEEADLFEETGTARKMLSYRTPMTRMKALIEPLLKDLAAAPVSQPLNSLTLLEQLRKLHKQIEAEALRYRSQEDDKMAASLQYLGFSLFESILRLEKVPHDFELPAPVSQPAPEAGNAWKAYIKQFPKLDEFWNNLPEVTNLWLSQQIDIFAGKYPAPQPAPAEGEQPASPVQDK